MKKWVFIGIFLLSLCSCQERMIPSNIDLSKLESPVVFAGDSLNGYRDPAVLFHNNRFYLFFTKSEIIGDSVFTYLMQSESEDLTDWTKPRRIVPYSQEKGYSGPGSIVRYKDEWVLCLSSYPRPGYTVDRIPLYADGSARLYTIRSKDLQNWSAPELIRVRGNESEKELGRMIDPFIVQDKDEPDKWWCFYKQDGMRMSYSYDLKNWTAYGPRNSAGERVCVLVQNNEYILFNSQTNGIRIRKSRNLKNWTEWGGLIALGQEEWEWAGGRIKGSSIINMTDVEGVNAYLMFFCGSGPRSEHEGDYDRNSSIGIAWSKDLIRWNWPQKKGDS